MTTIPMVRAAFMISLLLVEAKRYILGLSPRRRGRKGSARAKGVPHKKDEERGWWEEALGGGWGVTLFMFFGCFVVFNLVHVLFTCFQRFCNLLEVDSLFPCLFSHLCFTFHVFHLCFTFFTVCFHFHFFPRNGAESDKSCFLQKDG